MDKVEYFMMKHRMYEAVKKVKAKARISTKHIIELSEIMGLNKEEVYDLLNSHKHNTNLYILGILCEIDDTVCDFILAPIQEVTMSEAIKTLESKIKKLKFDLSYYKQSRSPIYEPQIEYLEENLKSHEKAIEILRNQGDK